MRMNIQILHFLGLMCSNNFHFTVTSALRTPEQNIACNGAVNSQHLTGDAIDFAPYGSTSRASVIRLVEDYVDFDQFIIYPTFFHISFSDDVTRRPRHEIIKRK